MLDPETPLLSCWSADDTRAITVPRSLDPEDLEDCRRLLGRVRPIVRDRRASSATLAELAVVMACLPRLVSCLDYLIGEDEHV